MGFFQEQSRANLLNYFWRRSEVFQFTTNNAAFTQNRSLGTTLEPLDKLHKEANFIATSHILPKYRVATKSGHIAKYIKRVYYYYTSTHGKIMSLDFTVTL